MAGDDVRYEVKLADGEVESPTRSGARGTSWRVASRSLPIRRGRRRGPRDDLEARQAVFGGRVFVETIATAAELSALPPE